MTDNPEKIQIEYGDLMVTAVGNDSEEVEERFEWAWKMMKEDLLHEREELELRYLK